MSRRFSPFDFDQEPVTFWEGAQRGFVLANLVGLPIVAVVLAWWVLK